MRIPVRGVLFMGQDRCPEFDPCREPLPKKLEVLLCLVDGVERRRKFQAKLNAVETTADRGLREKPMHTIRKLPVRTRLPGSAWAFAGIVALFSILASVAHINVAPGPASVADHMNSARDAHQASASLTDLLKVFRVF
jgi:hypothetical protein